MPSAPSILVLDNRDGGTPRVYRWRNGAELVQVGGNLPSSAAESTTVNYARSAGRRVIRFKGRLYCISNDGIYTLRDDDAWSKDGADGGLAFTSPATGSDTATRAGFEILYRDDKPYLYAGYKNTSDRMRAVWLDPDTDEWVQGNQSALVVGPYTNSFSNAFMSQVVYDGKIIYYVNRNGADGLFVYDPSTDGWNAYAVPADRASNRPTADMCVFNGNLYMVYIESSLNNIKVSAWDDGFSSVALNLGPGTQMMYTNASQHCIYTDGTYMYVAALQTNSGFRFWRITAELAATYLGMNILPGSSGITGHNNNSGFLKAYDISGAGTSNPLLFYRNGNSANNIYHVFRHTGPSSALAFVGFAGNVDHVVPHGGELGPFAYVPGQNDVLITGRASSIGSEIIKFKAWGGGTRSVKFYYATDGGTTSDQLALRGTATGGSAIRNGNQVDNVVADGTTEYSVGVDGVSSGITNDSVVRYMPVITH